MPDYFFKGNKVEEQDVLAAAEESGLTIEEDLQEFDEVTIKEPKVEELVIDSGSKNSSLEQPKELSSFDKWSAKVRKYTPNFLLTEREEGLKETKKLQEEKIEKERVSSDDYIKDAESFTKFIKDDFLVNEDYLKEKLGTDNLAAIDLKQDLGDLTKVIREDLGIAGMFGTDTRTQYLNLTNEDIDGIIKNQFRNKVKNQKLEIAERKKSNAIQSIIDAGGDVGGEISSVVDLDIASFDNPIERQLGAINKELRAEGLASEKIKELTDKQQELVTELNKPRKIIGRQGQIIEVKNKDKFKFFYNPVTGKSSGEKTEDSVDNTEKTQTYITEYSTTKEKLEDYYNDNVLQGIGHKKEGEKTYDIKVGNEAFSGILRNMGYKGEKGIYKNISISDMARFAHLFDDEGMGSGKKFMAENQIEAVNTDDFTSPEDFADYLLVHQEQGRDIAAKKSALKEVYILNKDITSIKKKPIQRHFEAASESIIGPRATESNFGYSNRKILDNIEEITVDAEIKLGDDQKEHLERSMGDEINEGFGGAYGILASLYGAGKVQGAVLGVTKLGRFMSTLAAPRYVKNGKVVSQSKLVKQAAKEGKSFDDLVAGYKKIGPSMMNRFNGLVLAGTMEEVKMQAVGFDPGVGAGFMLGAKALPFKFNTKYNQLNTALNTAFKGGPAFVLGTNFGELTKGAIEDIANEQEYSSFLEEHYSDLDKLGRKAIVDLSLGMLFGGTHLKSIDLKRTKDIAKLKNDAMSEMIKGYEQGNMNHVTKYQEIYSSAKNRLDAIDKIDLYSNPATAKKAYEKQLKPLVDAFKAKGKELQVEITSEELADGRNAEYVRAQGGQPGKIRINTKKAKPGLVPHEAIHATFDLLFEGNATVKAKFLNSIKNVTKNLKLESGESLYDAILREKSIKDVEKVEEMFAYTTEFLSRAENYTQFVSSNAFSNIRNTIEGFAERQGISKPELKTQQQLINFLGRYVETIQKGYNPVKQLERFKEIIDVSEASVKNQEAVGSRELNPNKSKDYFLNDQRIFEDSQIETPLYSLDKRMFKPDGTKKYNTKEEFQRSEDFMNFFDEVSRVLDVNHNFTKNNVIENLVKQDGQKAGVDVTADYINKVKDKLIVRTYNFDPSQAGGSLFGYFKNTAVPKEGLRIRTEEFEKSQEEGFKVELDKPTAKDAKKIEIEAEKSWTEKEFENEDLSISAQLRHKEYLEKTGLNVEEAEAYLPTGKGIDVAKNLKIEEPTVDLTNYDFTTVTDPKKSATYKNIGKQAIKQIGEYVYTKYYNIKKELFDIMKDTPSKNLNIPARTNIRTKIAKDVETHLKLKPQGAQELISKEGDILTPEWMRGHKNLATGLETIIEQNPLLYTKSSRTGKNLENYIMTPELIKYQKLGKVKKGTPEAEFKADFERRYLESIGVIDGKPIYNEKGLLDSKAQVKGRDYDQLLKAIMAQTTKAIHNQSVRKAINADPILAEMAGTKELLNQVAAGKSGAIASIELGKVYGTHLLKVNKEKMMQDVAAFVRDPLAFEKSKPKEHAAIKEFSELQNKYEAKIGREQEIKFTKEAKKLPYEWAQNGSWKVSSAKFKNDIKLVEEFKDNSFDLADIIPLKLNNTLGNAKMLVDLFTGHYGVIRGIKQYDKVNSPFKKGIRERLVNGKKSKLSPELQARWQNFNWDKLKSSYASEFYTGLAKVYQQKGLEAQKTEARKFIGSENGKLQIELYDLWNSTLQEWTNLSERGSKEYNNKMNFIARMKKHNSSIGTTGERVLAPDGYYYLPGKVVEGTLKYEHLKSSSEQSFESLALIANNSWTTKGKEGLKKYKGIWGMLKDFNIIDKQTGATNSAGIHRLAESLELAKNIYSVESNLNRTLYQDILKDVGIKEIKRIIKADKQIGNASIKKLKDIGLASKDLSRRNASEQLKLVDKALELGRKKNKESRGMSTFDFDETLVIGGKNFVTATKGKESIKISSEKFPIDGPKLAEQGYKFDFKDFVNVKGGTEGPLMQKLRNQIKKYGNENVYVLTARMQEAAPAIHAWLKSKGVELPIENITGLGNSAGEAKAMWMLKKFSEGYNDMYFVDDALPNVKAVKNVLNQLDIKSKVQQALGSKDLNKGVNKIMEHSLDIGAEKVFSKAEAKVRGKDIKRRRIFMRDSAADLELLIEPLYGKGKKGIENKKWFKEEFVMPFERGIRDYNTARQSAKNDYINLRKQNKDVVKEISKDVEGTAFTNDMAMRVYLWNKAGYKIPDLAKTTEAKLVGHIRNNPKLQAYAEQFARITKQEKGLKEPGENWWGETMAGEVTSMDRGISRKQYLQEFIDIKNEIFNEQNLNKMESKLGTQWRENITDMFDRMETGRTRSLKMDRGSAAMMNYLNGGIGTIMNFNTRSAVLQTISTTNFLNMRENNPISAARAMGNVKQFSKDFMYIMNSDMLKQRRDGLAINVTEAEIASAAASSKNMIQSVISKVLKAGYLPTKLADSFAISFGGATFYRNRIKMYEKQGMETKAAEKQAFLDFQVLSERTQQSSRADLLSKQQTSLIGRFILPFANTPMQMNRAGMKDILDISKGRFKGGRELTEKVGRISYYMGAQVAVFAGLQSALFAMLLNDDDVTEEKIANTKSMMLNSTTDSFLRGFGIQGALMSGFKNATQEYFKQSAKGYKADYSEVGEDLLNISPPIGSKFGTLDRAGDRLKFDKDGEFKFELGNPSLEASLMTVQAVTNAPVYSPYQNAFNLKHAMSDQYETWQRVLMGAGWTPYSVGVETEKKKKKKKSGRLSVGPR